MAAGSLLLAPLADRWGRRRLILVCLLLSGIGMLLSALAGVAAATGTAARPYRLGRGGVLASSNVIASEYSARRWRGLAVSLQGMGYALGATLVGLLAVWLLSHWGWRAVFCAGGLITLGALPLVLLGLPESLDFLLTRRPVSALVQVNRLARRLGSPSSPRCHRRWQAPAPPAPLAGCWLGLAADHPAGVDAVLSGHVRLLLHHELDAQAADHPGAFRAAGVAGGVLLSVGGIFGAALVGLLFARLPLSRRWAASC